MKEGGAEDKAERAPSNRETEAKKKFTVSCPTHLGVGSPKSQWKSLPSSPQRPDPFISSWSPPSPFPSWHPPHSPDLPAPRRPRMARLTSRGALCGPLPARGFPNTEDMATLGRGTRVLGRRAPSSVPARRGPRGRLASSPGTRRPAPSVSAPRAPRPAGCVPAARPEQGGGGAGGARRAGPPRAPPNSL